MRRKTRRLVLVPLVAAATAVALTGCTDTQLHGFLPGFDSTKPNVTNHTQRISDLWVGSWIVLLGIGVITWSLILWAAIAYRRRRGQTGLPVQLRYNMPVEVFFTVVPLILVVGLAAFTIRDETEIEKRWDRPDVTIEAYGKQWAWDFVYDKAAEGQTVYSAGIQAQPVRYGQPDSGVNEGALPVLYLPVNKKVEIVLRTRDVNHSFWVIDFLYKKDMIAGSTNYETIRPTRIGTYQGKCAELCGAYHSRMLFKVKVVSQADYDAQMARLAAAGNIGDLGEKYSKDDNGAGASGGEGSQNSGEPAGSESNEQGSNE